MQTDPIQCSSPTSGRLKKKSGALSKHPRLLAPAAALLSQQDRP